MIKELTEEIVKFNRERDWEQFHNGKDLAAAIAIEAAELQEAFLWKADADVEKVREELADILILAFNMANKYHLDVAEIIREKLAVNAAKYPVEKCRGTAKKYNEL